MIRVEVTNEADVTRIVAAFAILPVLLDSDYEVFLTGGFGPGGEAAILRAWRKDGKRSATDPTDWEAADLPSLADAVDNANMRPARLSADLTMSDGRTVHVPVVTPAGPASVGRIKLAIPYPASAMPGLVISAAVTNEELGVVFRSGFPYTHAQAGDTLTVEFGDESLDAEALAKILGEWPDG